MCGRNSLFIDQADLEARFDKAEQAGIRVEEVDPFETSQRCSVCGAEGTRDGDHFVCPECDRGRHADLNAAENIR